MERNKEKYLKEIGSILIDSNESFEMRSEIALPLLKLLEADYFASCVWKEGEQCFGNSVFLNMSPESPKHYERYYQYHDPITTRLQKRRKVTRVEEVMSYKDLRKTEFYNDFLKRDGLFYGLNYYSYDQKGTNIGDLRIWRGRTGKVFSDRDIGLLSIVADWFDRGLCRIRKNDLRSKILYHPKLTKREAEVCQLILSGYTNNTVAEELYISSETVKTHLKNIFSKLNVHHRAALAKELYVRDYISG